ncbi:hypothetical protein MKX03_013039 [Papaver bracteatum]|nr:hypothetical protein MKX03_013039 [Papaver bracteatum]
MGRISVLNDALRSMYNAEEEERDWFPQKLSSSSSWLCRSMVCEPTSFRLFSLAMVMLCYIGEFEYVDDHTSGKIVVELNGRLNKCGVIMIIETTLLVFGYIVLTTSAGIMDHEEARRKNVGGEVLGSFIKRRKGFRILMLFFVTFGLLSIQYVSFQVDWIVVRRRL